ncbi:MAG: ferrous iron transport protein A [Crenarchaeota archaeon]|nr:ferrous iron transport protein A [Thermoproteota archaeon]
MQQGETTTLEELGVGNRGLIIDIRAGHGLRRRLLEMGFTPGTVVEVLLSNRGPILVLVRGAVIALGRGVARKIIVRRINHA